MNRVKKIEDVIIGGGDVLIEMIEVKRKSGLVLPADDSLTENESNTYGIIVAVGGDVTDLEAGDIVLKTRNEKAPGYNYKGKELIMVSRYNIAVAIKRVNFDNTDELSA